MYIVLSYDISSKCSPKVFKLCAANLNHVQKSVFEGEITEKNLRHLKNNITNIINPEKDSVIIYTMQTPTFNAKEQIGVVFDKSSLII